MAQRRALFDELRHHKGIPAVIIDAVEYSDWHRPVRWVRSAPGLLTIGAMTGMLKPRAPIFRYPSRPEEEEAYRRSLSEFNSGIEAEDLPANAGEFLADCLIDHLMLLGDGHNAFARATGKLPRATIAAAAMTILDDQKGDFRTPKDRRNQGPGPFLTKLFRKLLVINEPTDKEISRYQARASAVKIFAKDENAGLRSTARSVGVSQGTLSRWKDEQSFKEEVARQRELSSISGMSSLRYRDLVMGQVRVSKPGDTN